MIDDDLSKAEKDLILLTQNTDLPLNLPIQAIEGLRDECFTDYMALLQLREDYDHTEAKHQQDS